MISRANFFTQILDNKPSFGPSNIYFYDGALKNLFYGKVLLSIETEEIDENFVATLPKKQDILMPLNTSEYWNEEIFRVNMILVGADALNVEHSGLKLSLACENVFSNSVNLSLKSYGGNLKAKFGHFESNERPVLSLSIKLPDHRLKYQVTNILEILVHDMVRRLIHTKIHLIAFHCRERT